MTSPAPLSPGARSLVSACRELYAAIDRLDQRAADEAGVTRNDLRALNLLEHGPVRAGFLAAELGLTTGAVSTLVDRLEARGLARRTRDDDDRRVVLVAPTDELFARLAPLYRKVALRLAEVADGYDQNELDAALAHLRVVIDAYGEASAHPR